MKVAPFFIPRKVLLSRLDKRNSKIISEHVNIAQDLPFHRADFFEQFRLSFAKFARKNNCKLSFENAGTQMRVERNNVNLYQGEIPLIYSNYHDEGRVFLPMASDQKNIFYAIKNGVKSILENYTHSFHYTYLSDNADVKAVNIKI